MDAVVRALKAGNANEMAYFFDERVDISLPGKSENYGSTQATMILKDFFKEHKILDLEIKYRGENLGSEFCFGILKTNMGSFRIKLYMKQKGSGQVLQEIGFQNL